MRYTRRTRNSRHLFLISLHVSRNIALYFLYFAISWLYTMKNFVTSCFIFWVSYLRETVLVNLDKNRTSLVRGFFLLRNKLILKHVTLKSLLNHVWKLQSDSSSTKFVLSIDRSRSDRTSDQTEPPRTFFLFGGGDVGGSCMIMTKCQENVPLKCWHYWTRATKNN